MKRLLTAATVASLLFAPLAFADDAHHPEKTPEQKAAPTAPAKPVQAKPMQQSNQSMIGMHERMQKMRDIMEKFQKTSDPKERQKLMDEHMQAMGDGMKMMNGMMMGMMDNHEEAKGKEGHNHCSMMGEHGMVGKRMDMMQMMMEQMMEHQKAAEGMTK